MHASLLFARRGATHVLDALLPPACPGCEARLEATGGLCPTCFAACHFITDPLCRTCGLPFDDPAMVPYTRRCIACTNRRPPFAAARAALAYNEAAKTLILPFKYAARPQLARLLAHMMARAAGPMLAAADCLVPVPLHRARLRHRGYNQAALLASRLARLSGVPALPLALHRPSPTPELEGANAATRHQIMHTAIAIRPGHASTVAGRSILLIDDVMTSGATATACTKALFNAGAAEVNVLVAARVPLGGLELTSSESLL